MDGGSAQAEVPLKSCWVGRVEWAKGLAVEALAAMTLRLRFQSSERPQEVNGLCSLLSLGPSRWGMGRCLW